MTSLADAIKALEDYFNEVQDQDVARAEKLLAGVPLRHRPSQIVVRPIGVVYREDRGVIEVEGKVKR